MGKPYNKELEALGPTYEWALSLPIDSIKSTIDAIKMRPLLAVGSGGSFSAATFAAAVHESYSGRIARAATPMDIVGVPNLRDSAVLFLSAGGKNADIRGALASVITSEPADLGVFCFAPKSPLSKEAGRYDSIRLIEHHLPSGKDGFLAVNSLLAFCVLLLRGYAGPKFHLPNSWSDFVSPDRLLEDWSTELEALLAPAWSKQFILLVHSADLRPAAIDFESKFSEAALGAVQLTDLRNFAHGRHHWLAKYPRDTGVLFLVSDPLLKIAHRTRRLLPASVFTAVIRANGVGVSAALNALISIFYLTRFAGEAKQIDPGRPGVPDFGGRIYSLNVWKAPHPKSVTPQRHIAVDRKISVLFPGVKDIDRTLWEAAYDRFVANLTTKSFGALICDYDGTLCDSRDRFGVVRTSVASFLGKVLDAGCYLGIATGRGGSVREALLQRIAAKHHDKVLIGYHNSAEIARLSSPSPDESIPLVAGPLKSAEALLSNSPIITSFSTRHVGPNQIGLRVLPGVDIRVLHRAVLDELGGILQDGLQCLMSSHSVDVIYSSTSKTRLISQIEGLGIINSLAIGDLGLWPGNDCALLRSPYSLSSGAVSAQLDSCWNLAPASFMNVQATLFYFKCMRFKRNGLTFDRKRLEGGLSAN